MGACDECLERTKKVKILRTHSQPYLKGEKGRANLEKLVPKVNDDLGVLLPSFAEEPTQDASMSSQSDYQLLNDLRSLALDKQKELLVDGKMVDVELILKLE